MSDDSGTIGTFRRFAFEWSPRILRVFWGIRFSGTSIGLLWDTIMQANHDALTSPYLQETNGPAYDALRPLGREMSMPQYSTENWTQYRSRLRTAWNTWDIADDEDSITGQLELAGFPGAIVMRWSDSGSWSDFVVFFPKGTHTVTSSGPLYGGGATYGDGAAYGPIGITLSELTTIKNIILHWKPAHWKARFVVWEISGDTYGAGKTYGQAGVVYGGEQARMEIQA